MAHSDVVIYSSVLDYVKACMSVLLCPTMPLNPYLFGKYLACTVGHSISSIPHIMCSIPTDNQLPTSTADFKAAQLSPLKPPNHFMPAIRRFRAILQANRCSKHDLDFPARKHRR